MDILSFAQDDLNLNLNSGFQTVLDITTDYLVSSQILERIDAEMKINMAVSSIFHITDEIVYPAVVDLLKEYSRKIPLIGTWLNNSITKLEARPYIRTLIQIITLLFVQKMISNVDIIELIVIMMNTYFVDYVAEIKVIKNVIDMEF